MQEQQMITQEVVDEWMIFMYRVSQKIVPNFEALFWSSVLLKDKNGSFF